MISGVFKRVGLSSGAVFSMMLFFHSLACGEDMVTRAYHLKNVDAANIIQVLNFAVANPTGKRILAGSAKHLVVTDTPESQDTVAELLPVLDLPSKQTDPKRAQMELVVRASRYLQQKKKAFQSAVTPGPEMAASTTKAPMPQQATHFTASVPYKSIYSQEDAKLTAKPRMIQEESVLPALSSLMLKGIFISAKGSPLALMSFQDTNFTARDGGLYERNKTRINGVASQVFKDHVILTGPDHIPRTIKFSSTL